MDWMAGKESTINHLVRRQFLVGMRTCMPRNKVFARYLADEELRKVACPTLVLAGRPGRTV
ncbi:hypothetical protein J31TS4_10290 [Paenibacillus sp. J31TS4]|nr:hypothetical protein J31TS4_10290 [Paenibacillus sp. J31TS4]